MLEDFRWKTCGAGERQAEKTPCRSHTSGGGISDALPGNTPGSARTSREASPSQRSFRARATAVLIVRPRRPNASRLLLTALYGLQPPGCPAAEDVLTSSSNFIRDHSRTISC